MQNRISAPGWVPFTLAALLTTLGLSNMLSQLTSYSAWYENWEVVPAIYIAALPLGVALLYVFLISKRPGLSAVRWAALGPMLMFGLVGIGGAMAAHSGGEFIAGLICIAIAWMLHNLLTSRIANGDEHELAPPVMKTVEAVLLGIFGLFLLSGPWSTLSHHGFVAFEPDPVRLMANSDGWEPVMFGATPALQFALLLIALAAPYFISVSALERCTEREENLSIIR